MPRRAAWPVGRAWARPSTRWPAPPTATTSARARPWPRRSTPSRRRCCGTCGCSADWVPHGDARILRVLAGGFEVANTDERLRELAGGPSRPAFRLGTLDTAWTRDRAGRRRSRRSASAWRRSAWGDPGADTPAAIRRGMRLSWAARVAASVPGARPWAAGAAALLVAREVLLASRATRERRSAWRLPLARARRGPRRRAFASVRRRPAARCPLGPRRCGRPGRAVAGGGGLVASARAGRASPCCGVR